MRAKSHGAMLKIIDDRQAALAAWCRAQLAEALAGQADGRGGGCAVLGSGTQPAARSTCG